MHIPQLVTIQFSLASTLTCVLIQNGPTTLKLAHQKTLTFNTQTPSSLCATKEVEKYWLLSVAVQVLIILHAVLWVCVCVCVCVMHPCTEFWLQHHIQIVSSDLSANSSNHTNPQLSTHNVQEFPKCLRITSNSRCLCTKFSCKEPDTSGKTQLRLPPLKKYSSL